jgi:arylformamidase
MLIDISVMVRPGTPEWPGDTPYSCGWTARIGEESAVNVSRLTMSPHVGTHADAPLHVRDGWPGTDALPLAAFVGRAWVCEVPSGLEEIALEDIRGLPAEGPVERLLLRTGCTVAGGAFPERWPVLAIAALQALLARGLVLLGVDSPSVDARHSKTLDVHHALFGGGAHNIESLDLRRAPLGAHELLALPLALEGLDGAPLRAALRPLARAER